MINLSILTKNAIAQTLQWKQFFVQEVLLLTDSLNKAAIVELYEAIATLVRGKNVRVMRHFSAHLVFLSES
ncbi:hypothetical protein WKK05_04515 [Nostoc sp. UHCC 0302]|uniref:hypothetical protein n=1 Tax=Nostoc sp. UHCC 0302 TaxID=3134896 RepID=UPI00311C9828